MENMEKSLSEKMNEKFSEFDKENHIDRMQ